MMIPILIVMLKKSSQRVNKTLDLKDLMMKDLIKKKQKQKQEIQKRN